MHVPGLDKVLDRVETMNVQLTESLNEISLGLNLVVDRLDRLIALNEAQMGGNVNPDKETI